MGAAGPDARLLGGLTWEGLADGAPRRLKRGRHYAGDTRALTRDAGLAADRMGKAVRTLRDEFGKWQYVWVQFADAQIPIGAACPRCESRELLRTHEHFGRCPRCGARLIFKGELTGEELAAGAARPRRPRYDLREFHDVELRYLRHEEGAEWWHGYGTHADGEAMLLLVRYPLKEDGGRVEDPERPGEPAAKLRAWPVGPFRAAIDLEALFRDDHEHAASGPPGDAE